MMAARTQTVVFSKCGQMVPGSSVSRITTGHGRTGSPLARRTGGAVRHLVDRGHRQYYVEWMMLRPEHPYASGAVEDTGPAHGIGRGKNSASMDGVAGPLGVLIARAGLSTTDSGCTADRLPERRHSKGGSQSRRTLPLLSRNVSMRWVKTTPVADARSAELA
jgi:hypothetical protein